LVASLLELQAKIFEMHIPLEVKGKNYDLNKGAELGQYAKDLQDGGVINCQVLSSTEIPAKTHYAIGVARDGQ
jgi:hypothetical protein